VPAVARAACACRRAARASFVRVARAISRVVARTAACVLFRMLLAHIVVRVNRYLRALIKSFCYFIHVKSLINCLVVGY
jgi:hypothetical protein